jgi:hypothetical protein
VTAPSGPSFLTSLPEPDEAAAISAALQLFLADDLPRPEESPDAWALAGRLEACGLSPARFSRQQWKSR